MALTLISKDELAARGALSMLTEYKQAIAELYQTYPKLLAIEQEEKRKATMIRKYGTLSPTKAQMAQVAAKEKAGKVEAGTGSEAVAGASAAPKVKKSHKKGAGKAAKAVAEAEAAALAATLPAPPEGSQEAVQAVQDQGESVEVTEGETEGDGESQGQPDAATVAEVAQTV